MDPNEALRELREAVAGVRILQDDGMDSGPAYMQFLELACMAAEALDDWLTEGGFLPAPWVGDGHPLPPPAEYSPIPEYERARREDPPTP